MTASSHDRNERCDSDSTSNGQTAYYNDPTYVAWLKAHMSYMHNSDSGLLASELEECAMLLRSRPDLCPTDIVFNDAVFDKLYRRLRLQNIARVVRHVAPLINPSAELLAWGGAHVLNCLSKGVNLPWKRAILVAGPRPQPDFAVGFKLSIFTPAQLRKLNIWFPLYSYFTATDDFNFPFLTTEVKNFETLNVADRQNAHSMTIAIRRVIQLFCQVQRQMELHRRVLAFSIYYDDLMVRLYAHFRRDQRW